MNTEFKELTTKDSVKLRLSVKETGSPIWIIATHGIGEHLGRHEYLFEQFGHSFNICTYDLRGHGKSGGASGFVDDFSHFMEDLGEVINFVKEKYKMERYVLFGHSMGGLITSAYVQQYVDENFYPEKVIINAPPVGFDGALGEIVKYAPMQIFSGLSKLPVSLQLGGLVDLDGLSHDVRVKDNYINDELNHTKLHTKLILEMVKTIKKVFSRPIRPKCPAVCTYGTEDTVVGPAQIENYFSMVEKAFKVHSFKGARHEIHNEIEKYRSPYFDFLKDELLVLVNNEA